MAKLSTDLVPGRFPGTDSWCAHPMDVRLHRELVADGWGDAELRQARSGRGEWRRIRLGAYGPPVEGDAAQARQRILAVGRQHSSVAISHESAALLHGLPVRNASHHQVWTTTPHDRCGGRRAGVLARIAPLPPDQLDVIDGVLVTSLARTVADLCRWSWMGWALAAGDAALRIGLDHGELTEVLATMRRWPRVIRGRRHAALLDDRSESPLESIGRAHFHLWGLPQPTLQQPFLEEGQPRYWVDFWWEQHRVIAEADGWSKYVTADGMADFAVLQREKRREDWLRARSNAMVRFDWGDLRQSGLRGRLGSLLLS